MHMPIHTNECTQAYTYADIDMYACLGGHTLHVLIFYAYKLISPYGKCLDPFISRGLLSRYLISFLSNISNSSIHHITHASHMHAHTYRYTLEMHFHSNSLHTQTFVLSLLGKLSLYIQWGYAPLIPF